MLVDCGWLGLFLGVSAASTTGASQYFQSCPRPLLLRPLYATFTHILRL